MWYRTLGFASYPLDPRSNPILIGVADVEAKIKSYIQQGNMCLLCGFTGSGKTSMLKRISKSPDLKQYEFIFITADGITKDYNIDDAIWSQSSFIKRLLRKKPRNLVVLLDESHLANRILTESIKSKWNVVYDNKDRAIQSVVVSQIEGRLGTNFSGSFADRLGSRIITMPRLTDEQLLEVLRTRLDNGKRNYIDAFSQQALDYIVDIGSGSVRKLLECVDAVMTAHESIEKENPLLDEEYSISKEAVFNVLQSSGILNLDLEDDKEYDFTHVFDQPKLSKAVEMFSHFGTLSSIDLAEKLDMEHKHATKLLKSLLEAKAVIAVPTQDEKPHYTLSPQLQRSLTKA